MPQTAITDYFPKRRCGVFAPPSKKLKLGDSVDDFAEFPSRIFHKCYSSPQSVGQSGYCKETLSIFKDQNAEVDESMLIGCRSVPLGKILSGMEEYDTGSMRNSSPEILSPRDRHISDELLKATTSTLTKCEDDTTRVSIYDILKPMEKRTCQNRDFKHVKQSVKKIHTLKKNRKFFAKPKNNSLGIIHPNQVSCSKDQEYGHKILFSLSQTLPDGLSLPLKYRRLSEVFRCTDIVVSILFNRRQVISWIQLQKSVKEMTKQNFELEQLAQIKTVFPSAYHYQQENLTEQHAENSRYQLIVEPILNDIDSFGGEKKFSSDMLLRRRQYFNALLLHFVHNHHNKFLSNLSPPIKIPQGKSIQRWHPEFCFDTLPDVEKSPLPEPPVIGEKPCTAKDFLQKHRYRFTKKTINALKEVAEETASFPGKQVSGVKNGISLIVKRDLNTTNTPDTILPTLEGISRSLLFKVRNKESENRLKVMMRSAQNHEKLPLFDKLMEVARALQMIYTTERKSTLPLEYVLKKLVNCCSGLSTEQAAMEFLVLLEEYVPTLLSKVYLGDVSYMKMTRDVKMAAVSSQLVSKRKEIENIVN